MDTSYCSCLQGREPELELSWTLRPRSNKENVAESTIIKHVDHPWLLA